MNTRHNVSSSQVLALLGEEGVQSEAFANGYEARDAITRAGKTVRAAGIAADRA